MYKLDLDISPKKVTKGSVQMFLNWVDIGDKTEPAMYFRQAKGGRSVAVLPLGHLYTVMRSDGYHAGEIVFAAIRLAKACGFSQMDRFAAKDVADLILEYADVLCSMPPLPPTDYELMIEKKKEVLGEASIKVDGKTVYETEVKE